MSMNEHPDHRPTTANADGHHAHRDGGLQQPGFWRSKAGLVAVLFLLSAAIFLISEHRAHALGVLPFLILLACPFLHFFMHKGHGGHGGDSGRGTNGAGPTDRSTLPKEPSS